MTATPPPMVSGIHLSPRAPLTWVNPIPMSEAFSSKRADGTGVGRGGMEGAGLTASCLRQAARRRRRTIARKALPIWFLADSAVSCQLSAVSSLGPRIGLRTGARLTRSGLAGSRARVVRLTEDRRVDSRQIAHVGLIPLRSESGGPFGRIDGRRLGFGVHVDGQRLAVVPGMIAAVVGHQRPRRLVLLVPAVGGLVGGGARPIARGPIDPQQVVVRGEIFGIDR